MTRASARESKFVLRCDGCGWLSRYLLAHRCHNCGHILDPFYVAPPTFSRNTMRRFADLLPFDPATVPEFLDDVPRTPMLRVEYKGAQFHLKDETQLPTHTTKDRMAVAALTHLIENGVGEFVMSSTGNSASAFVHYVGRLGGRMRCHTFVAREARHRLRLTNPYCEVHLVDGDFVQAGREAKAFAEREGLFWEGGFFNYARREGLKTAYLEAFEQMDYDVDVVIQTVSSGMGILGGYKGYRELTRFGLMNTRVSFICVQQDTCMPMVQAFSHGLERMAPEFVTPHPRGLAEAVLRGDPAGSYPYISQMLRKSGGKLVAISQSSLIVARSALLSLGINGCYASAASYAAARHLRESGFIRPRDRVLVMITGAQHDHHQP
jgi:threonine synthase